MKKQKIIITGRAHSGKTRFAEYLAKALGVKLLKTCTTRPRRTPDEDTYHFYTEAEAAKIPESEKLFQTFAVDGYERWTGKTDFLESGVAVLDMTDIPQAVRLWQGYGCPVRIVYVAADMDKRRKMWGRCAWKAGKDKEAAIRTFELRESSEAPMFDRFETEIISRCNHDANNSGACLCIFGEDRLDVWNNTYLPADMEEFIAGLRREFV